MENKKDMENEKDIKNGNADNASAAYPDASQENEDREKWRRRSGYIAAVIINSIILFVLNNLLNWDFPFLLESYKNCLWAINLSLGASIIANFVFIFYDMRWFKHLLEVFTSIAAFISLYVIYQIYPFTFTGTVFNTVFRIFLIVAMVGAGLGAVYNIIRTAVPRRFEKRKN